MGVERTAHKHMAWMRYVLSVATDTASTSEHATAFYPSDCNTMAMVASQEAFCCAPAPRPTFVCDRLTCNVATTPAQLEMGSVAPSVGNVEVDPPVRMMMSQCSRFCGK